MSLSREPTTGGDEARSDARRSKSRGWWSALEHTRDRLRRVLARQPIRRLFTALWRVGAGSAAGVRIQASNAPVQGGPGAGRCRGTALHVSTDPDTPALAAEGTHGASGVDARSDTGTGLVALSRSGYGVCACSDTGTGLYAHSLGAGDAVIVLSEGGTALSALSLGPAAGVHAASAAGHGVHTVGGGALGGETCPRAAGVFAEGGEGYGLYAVSAAGDGVAGVSHCGAAVVGVSQTGHSVDAFSAAGVAVRAWSGRADGVALVVEGRLRVNGAALGEVVLEAGHCALTVATPAATERSQVILTPLDDPGAGTRLWVSARSVGSFTVSSSRRVPRRIGVQYFIVN